MESLQRHSCYALSTGSCQASGSRFGWLRRLRSIEVAYQLRFCRPYRLPVALTTFVDRHSLIPGRWKQDLRAIEDPDFSSQF